MNLGNIFQLLIMSIRDSTMSVSSECLICNNPTYKILRNYSEYNFCKCDNCELLFVHPLPSKYIDEDKREDSFTNYNYVGTNFNDFNSQVGDARKKVKSRLQFLKEKFNISITSVFEIGAGLGAWSKAFEEMGIRYVGIEIDRMAVEAGQRFGANLMQADFISKNFSLGGNEKFDMVFSSQVLEHILEPHLFFERVRGLLRDDGIFYFDVPNPKGLIPTLKKLGLLKRRYAKDYCFLQPPWHYIAYNDHTIRHILNLHKYDLIYINHPGFTHHIFGQLGKSGLLVRIANGIMTLLNCGSFTTVIAKKRI